MLRVLLKTPLSAYTGYGNDGIGLARALIRSGADVYIQPTHVDAPLPPDVLALLGKRLEAPFDLMLHHVDPMQMGLLPQEKSASTIAVGWSMWEYSNFGNMKGRSKLRKALSTYDIVLGYDQVTKDAFDEYVNKAKTVTGVLQGGFLPENWPKVEKDWFGDRFGFCMTGMLGERKDPFVTIMAFKELKEEYPEEFEPAELHLKTMTPGLHSAMEGWVPKLRVHYASWPEDVLKQFYSVQHVLCAPSRGEGKNMPALEFQSMGGAVIATNWGGHTGWLSDEYAYPLNYKLMGLDNNPTVLNARADKDHMKALMLHTFRNRAEVKRKADLAAEIIPQMMSWDNVISRLYKKVAELVPGEGSKIYQKAIMSGVNNVSE
jgi:glycosyltransferase involved in cell wall biosynthesis